MDHLTRRNLLSSAVAGGAGLFLGAALEGTAEAQKVEVKKVQVKRRPGSEFIIKLNGIKLPAAEEERIGKALQATLKKELAKVDFVKLKVKPADLVQRIPKKWVGIIAYRKADLPKQLPTLVAGEL